METLLAGPLANIAQSLANEKPFGQWAFINACTQTRYERRLRLLIDLLPEAGALLDALCVAEAQSRHCVLADPTVRTAINAAIAHFKLDKPVQNPEEFISIFRLAKEFLQTNSSISALEAGSPEGLRIGPGEAMIWCNDHASDVAGQAFRRLLHTYVSDLEFRTPQGETLEMLREGTRLLYDLFPDLAASVFKHVRVVAIGGPTVDWERWQLRKKGFSLDSATLFDIPATIFIAPSVLTSPWQAAEYLLHECLHQKWYDLRHTHFMLRRGYQSDESPLIRSLWNVSPPGNPNDWPVCRSLAAFHVYVHLGLYFSALMQCPPVLIERYGSFDRVESALMARRSFDRAHYLGAQVRKSRTELGTAGEQFLEWLFAALHRLDPTPPPADAHVHLLLDLYERQVFQIRRMLREADLRAPESLTAEQATEPACVLASLINRELGVAEQVLAVATATAVSPGERPISGADLASAFQHTRQQVIDTLRSTIPEVFHRSSAQVPDKTLGQLVQEMVETSSAQIQELTVRLRP